MSKQRDSVDVAVVGGGLAGLSVAAYVARAGRSVRVLEKASTLGGRGSTDVEDGFSMNRGPHALYRGDEGIQVLRELGVPTPGKAPPSRGLGYHGGALHDLPGSALTLLGTSLLGFGEKTTVARFMRLLPRLDPTTLGHTSISEFLDRERVRGRARQLFEALFRLSTYQNSPALSSARTPVQKLQGALRTGVLYVDGGWRTLVEGLEMRAREYSATVSTSARVASLEQREGRVTGVVLGDRSVVRAQAVVLTCDPGHAAALLRDAGLPVPPGLTNAVPVRVAALDVALRRLPRAERTFVLGVDEPLYLSVHSASAKLAPEGAALIHVAKYLGTDETDEHDDRRELETLLDVAQPGWRAELVRARYLPRMNAAERVDRADDGGAEGRPTAASGEVRGLYFAGDWVQGGSYLVDASLGSAKVAAQAILSAFERMRSVA